MKESLGSKFGMRNMLQGIIVPCVAVASCAWVAVSTGDLEPLYVSMTTLVLPIVSVTFQGIEDVKNAKASASDSSG